MKIYTKTGDRGETSLVGGARVSKTHIRLEAYGTIDELNSCLGLCIASLTEQTPRSSAPIKLKEMSVMLSNVQHRLFNVGSLLACEDPKLSSKLPSLEQSDIEKLEQYIDKLNFELSPLTEFILPGGSLPSSHLHMARTIARRAERHIVALGESALLHPLIVPYVNRLSDYFFVLARAANHWLDHADITWRKDQ